MDVCCSSPDERGFGDIVHQQFLNKINQRRNRPDQRPVAEPADDPRARRRVLAQWRGIDLTAKEKAAMLRCRPISELTARVLQGMGLDRKRSEAEIVRVWNQLLDPTITAHAQPTGIRRGTLFISVDSSVWLDEIVRYRYEDILELLQSSFGQDFVTRLSFRAG